MTKKKRILVIGVFDLFHVGHLNILKEAKKTGNEVVVAINSDRIVQLYKRKPIIEDKQRLEILESCKYVDEVFIIDTLDTKETILQKKINIVIHGDDWDKEGYMKQIGVNNAFLEEYGVELQFVDYTKTISTSELINKIKIV